MRLRCLISDLDGTLFYTEEANYAAYRRAFGELGFTVSEEAYNRAFGLRLDDMVRAVAPGFSPEKLPILKHKKTAYYRQAVDLIRANRPLIEFLRSMKGTLPIALATTASRANAGMILDHFSVRDLFDVTVFGEDVMRGKPDPECYDICIRRCAVAPEECLVFEDSEVGVQAALAAGARVLLIPPGWRSLSPQGSAS